jgi:hypothetical protein
MLLLDDDDELPDSPTPGEASLAASMGAARLAEIDGALARSARASWLKVARVVHDALESGQFDPRDDASLHLHVRRVSLLVAAGILEAKGDLRRPRWSEVRLHRRPAV